ncbi:putative undecaprenyl-phosphate N-acetylglucosaminyl 1-phosphate transferase [[Clostridium] ultunense Esp]|uniref:Putative undecaprenyl-phosphate N-acetylglucosaminyl 1-phosphate transferase n=1 Tax=[Clostridium] ultunense Esp TaxID=1288971 RepID=M1ZAL3_9FIRM|nr:MraY family glycosyltransferase [Schnuerera ultunensis]CCQ94703.1 putative undecaprenyl-phosphate N-acetylglucosaminyl 1-phosphate transferase [[Clostridium] ultunense Esp]SHD76593.1 putative undecaprenyl-phosphate N-acetylglucosaminyl 1-phosphate transferase [[Clostridium] ultunense Esp]
MENIIVPFIISVAISLFMTPVARKLAIKLGAVDIPKDERRVHNKPMPLMGGLAIYIAILVSSLVFLPIDKTLVSIIIGGSIICISGIIDDIKGLSPKAKLVFQVIASIVLIIGDVKIDAITSPFGKPGAVLLLNGFSIPITIFWVVGITNTLNLIDGLDGLAAGVTMIASLSFLFVANKFNYVPVMIMSAIVAGSCIGFLPYNFNPAKIFMGDTGALFLGFIMAALSIEGVMKSVATIAVVVPIIILGVPIFDTTFAIFRRLLNGKSIAEADKGHLHHRLLKMGYSQKKTVLILYSISAIFGLCAILIAKINSKRAVFIAIVIFVLTILLASKMGLISGKKRDENEKD